MGSSSTAATILAVHIVVIILIIIAGLVSRSPRARAFITRRPVPTAPQVRRPLQPVIAEKPSMWDVYAAPLAVRGCRKWEDLKVRLRAFFQYPGMLTQSGLAHVDVDAPRQRC